jgi:hypothetical protein
MQGGHRAEEINTKFKLWNFAFESDVEGAFGMKRRDLLLSKFSHSKLKMLLQVFQYLL